ncbi:MAG: flippase-like domain-containing protein [Roseivirga sp.]|nr:flippase-like domain-containing protein [Roseivirga sp.]
MSSDRNEKAAKTLNPRNVWLPVIIGFVIIGITLARDENFTWNSLSAITEIAPGALLATLLLLLLKDFFNMLRIGFLSGGEFGLSNVFYVVLLWEFAIAVTPPVIGATAVLVFIMLKEGLSFGKALAYTMLAAIMDNLFFLTASPIALLLSEGAVIPESTVADSALGGSLKYLFYLSYGSIVFFTAFMSSAILFLPKTIRKLLESLMSLKWFKRWKPAVTKQSQELELASRVLKGKSFSFWLKLIGFTYLVWLLKYGIVNAVMAGFVPMDLGDHLLAIGRHLTMWVVMLVSPSPGNAGSAEIIFSAFYGQLLGDYTFVASLVWRMVTFYPYLVIGALILPKWGRRIAKISLK